MLIPPEAFVLPPSEQGSLQQRIRQMVTEGVLSGRFRPGQKMPSSRGLAEHLGVSRITVTLAYADLVAQDYLTSRGRSGYFVSDGAPRQPEFATNVRESRVEGRPLVTGTGHGQQRTGDETGDRGPQHHLHGDHPARCAEGERGRAYCRRTDAVDSRRVANSTPSLVLIEASDSIGSRLT